MAREMKDSGITWVGDIPESWESKRLKYLLTYNDETLGESTEPDFEFDYIDIGSVEYGKGITQLQHMVFKDAPSRARRIVKTDDIILSTVRTYLKAVAAIPENDTPLVASTGFIVLRALQNKVTPRFLNYAVLSNAFISMVEAKSVGISYPAINASVVVDLSIPVPELSEQNRIASFLDSECSRIDAVIEQTRASIEEYKKLKQAVITHAVTKGIRPDRQMKDSGIEWVKELPDDWTVIPAKFLFRNSDTRKQDGDEQMTASQQYGIITQERYMELTGSKVVFANKGLEDWKHVEPFDFVISLRSFQGGLEMSETTGCITWHYIVLKPCKEVYSYYYKWLFKSELYIKALQRTCNFIRDGQDLRYSNFIQVPLFEPSLDEQKEIAEYLNKKCAEIDELITQKERLLAELETYKKSLIYEYVTGKKEVK